MPANLRIFTDHSRLWQQNRYVYPVVSRRSKGLSIGVNLNPDKVCNFDCVYCCVDRTVPATIRKVDLDVIAAELEHLLDLAVAGEIWKQPPFEQTPADLRRLNDVAFSGDGEPTSFPHFASACELVARALHRRHLSAVKIVVITNATLLHQKRTVQAMHYLDQHNGEIWAKLEAGTQAYYELIERTKIPLARVLENILAAGRVRPLVIQSLFMKVHGSGPDEAEIAAYIERLRELRDGGCRIKLVQVYTVARQAAEAFVAPLGDAEIDAIAGRVRGLGVPAEGYYGPS